MKSLSKLATMFCLSVSSTLVFTACDSKKESEVTEKAEVEINWDWKNYQKSSELVLQTLPVDIQPKRSLEIKSKATGIITFEIEEKKRQVEKDFLFAKMDVDSLAEQAERQLINEERQRIETLRAETLEHPEKKKNAREELKEAERKVRLMELIIKNPAMEEMSTELFSGDIGAVNEKTLMEAQESLDLAKKKLAYAEEHDEKLWKDSLRIKEMDNNNSRRKLDEAKDGANFTAPFKGELRLEVDFVDGETEYNVQTRETIATLNDYSEIHGHLKVNNAGWVNLSPKRLSLQLKDRNRTLMPFQDDRTVKDERTKREERIYVFSVPLEDNNSLKRLVGTQMRGELIYKLPQSCFIVPKYDLSLYALGKTDSVDWTETVEELWPGAKVLAEGLSELAISYQP